MARLVSFRATQTHRRSDCAVQSPPRAGKYYFLGFSSPNRAASAPLLCSNPKAFLLWSLKPILFSEGILINIYIYIYIWISVFFNLDIDIYRYLSAYIKRIQKISYFFFTVKNTCKLINQQLKNGVKIVN